MNMSVLNDDLSQEVPARRKTKHLALDSLVINPRLARRLPPATAFRYHALPLAEDKRRITVAMSDPDDNTALEAITAALGTRPYIVHSDSATIDNLLAEIWFGGTCHSSHVLIYHQASPIADQVQAYARHLSDMLGGTLADFQSAHEVDVAFDELIEAAYGYDLIVMGEPDQSLIQRLLCGPAESKVTQELPCSVLIASRPHWPLRRILLIIRGQETGDGAVDWTVRLAQPSNANVTVLAMVPSTPGLCDQVARVQHGLGQWLATDTTLGRQMRRMAQHLVDWEAQGTLRFRQGSPESQIQREVVEGDYDLIIMTADPPGWWSRRLFGELVAPLLRCADQPVLIAKPMNPRDSMSIE